MNSLGFGERDGKLSDRTQAIADVMSSGNFGAAASQQVIQDMWEKWVFLASLAASTCTMRAPIGHILAAPGGKDFVLGMLEECSSVASATGHAPTGPFSERARGMLTTEGSQLKTRLEQIITRETVPLIDFERGFEMVRSHQAVKLMLAPFFFH